MKYKKIFIDYLKDKKKTKELRKIKEIEQLGWDGTYPGRLMDNIIDEDSNSVGIIYFNGYAVIDNVFNLFPILVKQDLYGCKVNKHDHIYEYWNSLCELPKNGWMYDHFDWIVNYFKDEKEIVVLKIDKIDWFDKEQE